MGHTVKISPSILSADPLNFERDITEIERSGGDWHHVDVMDGHYVPNLTYGLPFIKALKEKSKIPLDVHIMITNPDETALEYVKAGADYLVFHAETSKDPVALCKKIEAAGAKPGLAVHPDTALSKIFPILEHTYLVNVMSVYPGFSGQKFIPAATQRVHEISEYLKKHGLQDKVLIEVDGGINTETAKEVVKAGARVLVAGHFVYRAPNRAHAISELKKAGA